MPGNRYRRGAHTVLELKYHYVWKTKYSYKVLRGDVRAEAERANRSNLCGERDSGSKGERSTKSYPSSSECPGISFTGEDGAVSEWKEFVSFAKGVCRAEDALLGTTSVE